MDMAVVMPMPMPSPERNPPPRKWIKQWCAICCFLFLFPSIHCRGQSFINRQDTCSSKSTPCLRFTVFSSCQLYWEILLFFLGLPQSEGMVCQGIRVYPSSTIDIYNIPMTSFGGFVACIHNRKTYSSIVRKIIALSCMMHSQAIFLPRHTCQSITY